MISSVLVFKISSTWYLFLKEAEAMEHVKYILKQSWSRHSSSKWTEECP
ncbi:hypothetical protein GUF51_25950, partial [Xanthomonas citri pv. citri]|nr:hypothetical protein [Xanthomonas citri pv. citri]